MSEKTIPQTNQSRPEVILSLHIQAETQLNKAIVKNEETIQELTKQMQQAQADKIAFAAQLALVKKISETADTYLAKAADEQKTTTE